MRIKQINWIAIVVLISTLGTSCIPADTKVEPAPRLAKEYQFNMGSSYKNQIFFDLGTGTIVKEQLKTVWDFGIDPQTNSIVTNTGRFIHAGTTSYTDLNGDLDSTGVTLAFDSASGDPENRTLANYSLGDVFLIDLGYNLEGWPIGHAWVKIEETIGGWDVHFRYAKSSQVETRFLSNQTNSNFSYFSILDGKEVEAEPEKTSYDLIFRQYIYYFDEEKLPYYVTGALLNWEGVKAYEVPSNGPSFEAFTKEDVDASKLVITQDIIGYDWKYFDFDAQTYVTSSQRVFIVEDHDGLLYKLRFTSFYSDAGEKGSPKMEMVLL